MQSGCSNSGCCGVKQLVATLSDRENNYGSPSIELLLPNVEQNPEKLKTYFIILSGLLDFDSTVVFATFQADELEPNAINQIPAQILIVDDEINEAREQLFLVTLSVFSAADPDRVDNNGRNISLCRIIDNDRKY